MTGQDSHIIRLGKKLRELRDLRGWSLREVESKTGVSNGYIYLLEKARVKEPSPKILEKLAAAYNFEYERLLQLAGYLSPAQRAAAKEGDETLLNIIANLSESEREEVKSFVKFLASKRER